VRATPDPWLDALAKYVRAAGRRAEKLRGMQGATATAQFDLAEARRRYAKLALRLPAGEPPPPELVSLRWLIAEYGVQLFAQEQGTRVPVSAKRVAAAFEAAEARLARG